MSNFPMSVHWRTCPKCNEHKFIGHGPLCLDCFLGDKGEEDSRCPRRQCRGRLPHSRITHWFGWARR